MTSTFDIQAFASGLKMIPASAKGAATPTTNGVTHQVGIKINDFALDKISLVQNVNAQTYNLPTAKEWKDYLGANVFRKGLIIYQRIRNNSNDSKLNTVTARGYANGQVFPLVNDKETVIYLKVTSTIAEGDDADLITVSKFDDINP